MLNESSDVVLPGIVSIIKFYDEDKHKQSNKRRIARNKKINIICRVGQLLRNKVTEQMWYVMSDITSKKLSIYCATGQ